MLLSLQPKLYELVTRVARAQGKSRAKVIHELVQEVAPALERIVVLSELYANAAAAPKEGLRRALTTVEESLHQAADVAGEQMDALVDLHMRDTMRTAKASQGKDAHRAAKGAPVPRRPGPQGKGRGGAVKRSRRAKRAG